MEHAGTKLCGHHRGGNERVEQPKASDRPRERPGKEGIRELCQQRF